MPVLSRNISAAQNVARFASLVVARQTGDERPLVVIVGGRISGQGCEALLDEPRIELVESDVRSGPRTNLICDAHRLPFPDGSVDGVVAQAVLEHVLDPYVCAAECVRVLKTGGVLYAETPFMQQVHGGAYDFTRFTYLGQRRLFRTLDEIDSGIACGPAMALAWSYSYFLKCFAKSKRGERLMQLVARLTAFWLPWLDGFLSQRPAAFDAASAFFFLGRKGDAVIDDRSILRLHRGR